jgi:concanavalin A-like lectin/glucanase superfamily protein
MFAVTARLARARLTGALVASALVFGQATAIADDAGPDSALVHQWTLDRVCRGRTPDSVGGRTGTLRGGATLVSGRVGNAVQLDGVGGYVSTTGVEMRTDSSFTVSAWVFVAAKEPGQVTAVSVDGDRGSNFRLGHVLDKDQHVRGNWVFDMPVSDTDTASVQAAAVSVTPAPLDAWVHLVGVHDATTKRLWLYVDGVRVANGTLDTPWQARGGVQIGRAKVAGSPAQFWPGLVDDARIYNTALTTDQISALRHSYDNPASD